MWWAGGGWFILFQKYIHDWFDTDEGDTVLDSTVLVDEDNITDCGVIDDQRND